MIGDSLEDSTNARAARGHKFMHFSLCANIKYSVTTWHWNAGAVIETFTTASIFMYFVMNVTDCTTHFNSVMTHFIFLIACSGICKKQERY